MLQQIIDEQSSGRIPRYAIFVENATGSATLKKGMQLVLFNPSDVDITGEGENEISITGGNGLSVTMQSGNLRFDETTGIRNVDATDATVNCEGADIESLILNNCQSNLFNNTIQSAEISGSSLDAFGNTWESLTINGGQAYFDDETIKELVINTSAQIEGVDVSIETLTCEQSSVVLEASDIATEGTITDSHILISGGTLTKINISGRGTAVFNTTTFEDELSVSDGPVHMTDCTLSGTTAFDTANVTATAINCEGEVTATECQMVSVDSTFTSETTLTDTSSRLSACTFSSDFSMVGGACDSNKNTFSGTVEIDGGYLQSQGDTFLELTAENLVGRSHLRSSTAQQITLSGDGTSFLLIDHVQGIQNMEIANFTTLNVVNVQAMRVSIEYVSSGVIDYSTLTQMSIENSGVMILNDTNVITNLLLDNVRLAVTNAITSMEVQDSTLIDKSSIITLANGSIITGTSTQIVESNDCIITAQDGVIVTNDSLVVANNGAVVATGSTYVATSAAEVINPQGLSVGVDFAYQASGGALCYDGDLNLFTSIGNIFINALVGNVITTAVVGDILSLSGGNTTFTATGFLDMIGAGGVGILSEGVVSANAPVITITGDESITLTAPIINTL